MTSFGLVCYDTVLQQMEHYKVVDHSVKKNHVINCQSTKIVEKEREDLARVIKEAIYIGKLPNMNRDEGRYHLSHLYDNLLGVAAST